MHFVILLKLQEKLAPSAIVKKNCSAEKFAIRDQIVIGTNNEVIREKAILKNWHLQELRKNGMKYESAAAGEEKMLGETLNKTSPYLFRNLKKNNNPKKNRKRKKRKRKEKNATDVVHISNLII